MLRCEKIIISIICLVSGGTLLITSLVFGVIALRNSQYDNLFSFPVSLSKLPDEALAGSFSVPAGSEVSLWLKVADRRIENPKFQLSVSIKDEKHGEIVRWNSNFSLEALHDGSGEGQYYFLGTHYFYNNFKGHLAYRNKSKWISPYNGVLVLRKQKTLTLPQGGFFLSVLGAVVFAWGAVLLKNNNKAC